MSAVEWYIVPNVSVFWHEGHLVNGYWMSTGNRIVLAEAAVEDGGVVRHEMLHAQQPGSGHARHDFVERCGGVVLCLSACLDGAGRAPEPSPAVRRATAAELEIDVELDGDESSDYLTLIVSARNPTMDSVIVSLPPTKGQPRSSFGVEVNSDSVAIRQGVRGWDSGTVIFGPGQTRRAVFDFRVSSTLGGSRALAPGTYSVRGAFGAQWSARRSVTVAGQQQ